MSKLSFWGGAQEVTGANYLVEAGGKKILVDCGMFQCPRFCMPRNQEDFSYDPASVEALFVTHAHIDHTGRIPRLVRKGFRGMIYSTPPTRDFARLMMEDSLGVLEKEASHHGEGELLYGIEDIETAMNVWRGMPYKETLTLGELSITLHNAGHILGSSMIEINAGSKKLLFTGDLGNAPMPLLDPPHAVSGIAVLVIESAYGDRKHEDVGERKVKLERAIEDVVKRGGTLMIPAFALERTQELLAEMNDLAEHDRIPRIPVYLDSPLSIKATAVYKKYQNYFNGETQKIIRAGDDLFQFPGLHMTLHTEESKEINGVKGSKIIIAGAGMMQGGRILHHARRYLSDKNNMILFIGYQAAGSLGRRILDGERTVTIFGEEIPVFAEVRAIHGYSAHADMPALLDFIKEEADDVLEKAFIVQGEPSASLFLAQRARDYLGVDARAPHFGEVFEF